MGRIGEAVARSNLYRLLALGFGYPEPEQYAHITDGGLRRDLTECIAACVPEGRAEFDSIADHLSAAGSGIADLEADYLNSFHTNQPSPSASLYESDYIRNSNKPAIMLELGAFYQNFGLAVSQDCRELEDALTGELEFMYFLAAKEAQARNQNLKFEPYVLAQRDFVARHLAVWIPCFQEEVEKKSPSPFYRSLARVARLLVDHDAETLPVAAEAS